MTGGEAFGDLRAKVTGAAVFASDSRFPGMLHGALVRSDVAHGLIVALDTAEAEAMPGVTCVLTPDDFDGIDPFYGELVLDQPMLAIDRVRYVGEPIAAVVARTRREAVEAARLVQATIEPLPPLFNSDEAMGAGAERLHPNGAGAPADVPNICRESRLAQGDVDAALAAAAYVHHAVYECPPVYHYAMEPHCSLASWEADGLHVISGTQQPFRVRDTLARMFAVPTSRVRVRAPYVGGAFGSKGEAKYEPVVAAMARKAGRPVQLLCSVEESVHTVTRHGCRVEMWTGLDSSNTIVARRSDVTFDTGAYSDKGPRIAHRGAHRVTGPYRIANYEATSRAVFTNTVPAGAFRGFSTSQVLWASESAMDEIARHVGEDPLEFRRRHLLREGEPYLGFDAPVDADLGSDLDEAARLVGSATPSSPDTGTGLAIGVKDGGGGAARAAAHLRIHPDGSVEVHAGAAELGQGAQRVLARVAAEGLGVEVSRVEVRLGDTATAPFDRGTNASRTTVGVGMAVAKAAASARVALKVAWLADGGAKGSLRLDGADLVAGEDRRPMVDVLARGSGLPAREFPGLAVTGTHTDTQEEGSDFFPTLFYEVCATGVRVHVDRETGEIRVEHLASVVEAGHVLDEAGGHGQNVGAAMMGLGTSLTEELVYSQGELINANLIEYRVPTIAELPPGGITSVLVENAEGPGPGGAKGIGEAGIIAVAPALANAVEDAVGVRLRRLPLHPEAVWRALNQTAGSSPDERGR